MFLKGVHLLHKRPTAMTWSCLANPSFSKGLLLIFLIGGVWSSGCGDEGGGPPSQDVGLSEGDGATPDPVVRPDASGILPEPDEPEEEAPPLVEDRLIETLARTSMLIETVTLPEGHAGDAKLFAQPASELHGHTSAGGLILGVGRDGNLAPLLAGWDQSAELGQARAIAPDGEGGLLVSTDIGLLFLSDGLLWPSPVSEVVLSAIRGILIESLLDEGARPGRWFASDRGLYHVLDGEIFHVGPGEGVSLESPVRLMALGPDLEDPLGNALWVVYGQRLFALRPEGQGVASFSIEVDFGGDLLALGADDEGHVWVATETRAFMRRSGPSLGAPRWVRWSLPAGRTVRDMTVGQDGAVWLLTDQTVYRTLDRLSWEAVLVGPVQDIVAIAAGEQGSAWITRRDGLSHAFVAPPLALVGVKPGQDLEFMPDLEVFPTLPGEVVEVIIQVDDCSPRAMSRGPYVVLGGGAIWSDCLTPGAHELRVSVLYEGDLPEASLVVPFEWRARPDDITWDDHIEPIYARYCARANCHVGGFEPDSFETWSEKVDNLIVRISLPEGEPGQMPPSGASPSETEILLIRWWREDGLLRQ